MHGRRMSRSARAYCRGMRPTASYGLRCDRRHTSMQTARCDNARYRGQQKCGSELLPKAQLPTFAVSQARLIIPSIVPSVTKLLTNVANAAHTWNKHRWRAVVRAWSGGYTSRSSCTAGGAGRQTNDGGGAATERKAFATDIVPPPDVMSAHRTEIDTTAK